MIINQSESSSVRSIEEAGRAHRNLFVLYVLWLLLSSLLTALLTYLLWNAGNKQQGAVIADANARIAEARTSAAQANERAQKLENDNLILRGQVATLETQAADAGKELARLQKAASDALAEQQRVQMQLAEQQGRTAKLEKAASDARAAQQNVETELARQQERAATAERALAEVKKSLLPRGLPINFLETMKGKPKGEAIILYQQGSPEILGLATILYFWLKMVGWQIPEPLAVPSVLEAGKDFALGEIFFKSFDPDNLPEHIEALRKELWSAGHNVQVLRDKTMARDAPVQILIGPKLY